LSAQVLIHLTSQPRAWPLWLKQAGISEMTRAVSFGSIASRRCWSRRSTALASRSPMAPLIKARPCFRQEAGLSFDLDTSPAENDLSGVAHRAGA